MAGVIREGRRNGESGQLDSVWNAHGSHQVSAAQRPAFDQLCKSRFSAEAV